MTIAILATGDEIIHGDTLNTNAHHIAQALSSEGIPLGVHLCCGDKKTEITECLQFLTQKNNIIILIGGLGPTTDDVTRFALADFCNELLIENPAALQHIQTRLKSAKIPLNPGNLQQSLFPEKASILPNPQGSAVGCQFLWNKITFFLLPGPPRECLPMFNDHVLPKLQQTQHSHKQILKWRIFGLAESEIAETLENALTGIDCHTGYRLDVPYIEFKVRCSNQLIPQIKEKIDPILAPHVISSVENKASEALQGLIVALNQPITIIDEATGGLLQNIITKPDTHHLIHWNGFKKTKLFFHLSGLHEYWEQWPNQTQTQLTIHYSNPLQEGGETHQIPYRSPLVTYYAAEWLSFRLFHLINQLHQ